MPKILKPWLPDSINDAVRLSSHRKRRIKGRKFLREERRMENLFERCEGWEKCKNEDLKKLFEKKMIEREKFKLPEEDELELLNEICKECNYPLKIEEMKCPICGNEDLRPVFIRSEKFAHDREIFNYRCKPCDRVLSSYINFF